MLAVEDLVLEVGHFAPLARLAVEPLGVLLEDGERSGLHADHVGKAGRANGGIGRVEDVAAVGQNTAGNVAGDEQIDVAALALPGQQLGVEPVPIEQVENPILEIDGALFNDRRTVWGMAGDGLEPRAASRWWESRRRRRPRRPKRPAARRTRNRVARGD